MKIRRSHSSSSTSPHITVPYIWILLAAATLALMTACRLFTGENTPLTTVDESPVIPSYFATPVAQSPAAGICAKSDGDIVTFTIYPDIPDPRCVEVTSGQMLRVINRRTELLHVLIGTFEVDIEPDGEYVFDTPVGKYLLPGVHLLQVSPCCSPEIIYNADPP